MKLNFKNQFSPSIRNRNHVDILYLPHSNGEHRYPETSRRRKGTIATSAVRQLRTNCIQSEVEAYMSSYVEKAGNQTGAESVAARTFSVCVDERKRGGERDIKRERDRDKRVRLTISNLTLLTKGDVVRNLLTAVNIFPSNVAALPASCLREHPGPMSAPSPGLGNNSRQSPGPRSLFFSSSGGPSWLCSSAAHRRTLNDRAQHVSASEPVTG